MINSAKVDRLVAESVSHRINGNFDAAIRSAESAMAACGEEFIPPGPYLVAGLAYAMAGQLQNARQYLQLAVQADPSQSTNRYFLASVLACLGEISPAAEIFSQDLEIPVTETESTSTRIIQLFSTKDTEDYDAPPFGRSVSSFLKPVAETQPELVVLVACDGKYLELFIEPLIHSLKDRTQKSLALHVHVVNPTTAQLRGLAKLSESSHCPVYSSHETIIFPSLSDTGKKTYFSCARFLIAPEVAAHYGCPLLITDVDQMIVSDLDPLFAEAEHNDICLLKFPQSQFNLLSLFSASVFFANATNGGNQFLRDLSDYITRSMRDPTLLTWHLDQAAIAAVYLQSTDVNIGELDPQCMHSSLDGSSSFPETTVFWSITYHVLANSQKLESGFFRSLRLSSSVFPRRSFADDPRVTIVMPVYNGGNYLKEAIESALAQTWGNIEVLVVNDGSTDEGETDQIARAFGERIRYISKENGGVASALNRGIEEMSGDVFCWLSHDDLLTPDKTEKQMAIWAEHGYADMVLYSDYRLIDESGKKISDVRMDHQMLSEKPVYALFRAAIHGCSVFVPREIFDDVGRFDESLPTTQDYDLWSRMIRTVPFVHIPEQFVMSRWHDEQGSKQIDHREEAADFWSGVLRALPREEQILLEGSGRKFLKGMAEFLRQNGILVAAQRAEEMAASAPVGDLVSIVIPIYNRFEKALSAIESALAQTHENIEVIVVDDGSEDDAQAFLERVSGLDERIRTIAQENLGPGAARNAGWQAATGEFVAFLDSDDLLLPQKVEVQLAKMKAVGATISHTSYWKLDEPSMKLTKIPSAEWIDGFALPNLITHCPIATPTVMLNRRKINKEEVFAENGRIGEDVITWIRLASVHPILGVRQPLSVVRTVPDSAAKNLLSQQQGIRFVLGELESDPTFARYETQLAVLRESLN